MSPTPASNANAVASTLDKTAMAHRANLAELRKVFTETLFLPSLNTVARPHVNVRKPGSLAFDTEPLFDWPPRRGEPPHLLAPIGTGRPGQRHRTSLPTPATVVAHPDVDEPEPGSLAFDTEPIVGWPSNVLPPIGTGRLGNEHWNSSPTPANVGWYHLRSPPPFDTPTAIPHRPAPGVPRGSLWHPDNLVQPAPEHVRHHVDNVLATGHPSHCHYCRTRQPEDAPCPYRTYGRNVAPPQDPQLSVRHSRTSSTTMSCSGDLGPSGRLSSVRLTTLSDEHEPPVRLGRAVSTMDDTATYSPSPSPSARSSRTSSMAENTTNSVSTSQDYYALLAQSESSLTASVVPTPSESDWSSADDSGYDPDNEQSGPESMEDSEWDSEQTSESGYEFVIVEVQEGSDSSSDESDDTDASSEDEESEYDGFILL
ncbi:hypothetical protein BDU57DRAFT_534978 [Ampelomyces quisqualis]|uniref:Uncharacterized protein n=1 Tax=Ampelomyces quisqualis TaxID=50730 RepID=A0A6A5R3A4_AMPQU|nr:hypothetical protein BDU57DRAFT_534978 [Ampelomyces quisqualis]